jgi:ABC-type Na+ efflux pump permease subunit
MRRIFAQAQKELTQLLRDRLAVALALLLPVILLLLQTTAISLTVKDLPIIVQDLDQSQASQKLVDAFRQSLSFHVASWPTDKQPEEAFASNKARGALIIPEEYGRRIARGEDATVQILVDASDENTAQIISGDAAQIVRAYNAERPALSRSRRRFACGTTRAARRKNFMGREFTCWPCPFSRHCWRRWPCPKKASRKQSFRSTSRTFPRMNSCSAKLRRS